MSANRDFLRQMPSLGMELRSAPALSMRMHFDPLLLLPILVVLAAGGFVLYSASGQNIDYVIRQGVRVGIALVVMITLAQFDPRQYRGWSPWIYLVGLVLVIGVLFYGADIKGAQRWLTLPGGTRFQPSELMKLALPMMLAWYLGEQRLPPRFRHVLVCLVLIALPAGIIARQPDLGTALLIAVSGLLVLWLAGLQWRFIFGFATLAAAAAPLLWYNMHEYQQQRVLTLLDLGADPLGAGWNINQSMIAIGSGGMEGKGWLQGTQSQLDFLPESHTDFIIAVLAEEWGLMGVLALLCAYLMIIARGIYIGMQAQDTYSRLLAGTITLTFFVYVFVNIGMVAGILPVVGVPLPLISYGGTSVVTLMAGFGMLMSIQTHRKLLA